MPPSSVFAVVPGPVVGVAVPAALGLVAVYLLLPRPGRRSVVVGALLGVAALVVTGILLVTAAPSVEGVLFYIFSAIAIVAGALLITQRNPARAALSFALVVLSTCGLFLLLAAPFLMAATIIIYAGAIIVTFLFVLMLAQQEGLSDADYRSREPMLASFAGFLLLGTLLYVLWQTYRSPDVPELDGQLQAAKAHVDELTALAAPDARQPDAAEASKRLDGLKAFLTDFQTWVDQHTVRAAEPPGAKRSPPLPANGGPLGAALEDAAVQVRNQDLNVQAQRPVQWDELRKSLLSVQVAGLAVRNSFGVLQPPSELPLPNDGQPQENARVPLSPYSGPPANVPLQDLRRDAGGRPELPAENVAYLGRSLFTDFLLPVELGGTLLLVATIGAIAIASRRAERLP
jgi:NADH:ubiquinone oxidoreductase subunit 6 (subunit J)